MAGQPRREDWRAWQEPGAPEPRLLTTDELLATAERLGIKVDARDLRYWAAEGVLPGPVRRRHNGATRALYPRWMVDLIYHLRRYQDEGFTLARLAPRLRASARHLQQNPFTAYLAAGEEPNPTSPPNFADFARWYFDQRPVEPLGYPFTPGHLSDESARQLASTLGIVAAVYRETEGITATTAQIRLLDEAGREALAFTLPLRHFDPLPEPGE